MVWVYYVAKIMQTSGKRACSQFPECRLSYAKIMQTSGKKACFQFPECRLSYTKIMQTSGKKACFQFPECRLFYTKIVKGESNGKIKKRRFFIFPLPSRLLSYEKIVKGECNIKIKNSVVIYNEPLQTKQELIGFVIILLYVSQPCHQRCKCLFRVWDR